MAFQTERRRYRLTGLTPILGSQPADPDVRTSYIASRAPASWQGAEEADMLPDNAEDRGVTVFLQRPEDNALCLMDYMLVGFIKESLEALSADNGILQARSKAGRYVFAAPRTIPLIRGGAIITDEDAVLERPLRASTMRGERVTLTASECIYDPWQIEFELTLVNNNATAKSRPVTWEAIESALDYGAFKGLSQWRNGGYGRFTWERMDEA